MSWKERLKDAIPETLAAEIDGFEAQMALMRDGKLDEKLFAEARLRRGTYGQRYDNGQRHDGTASRVLAFPSGDRVKGPSTLWDAPGMQRIKIPYGKLSAQQLDVLAECAEEYSDGILHITTRQDVQLHFVHIDDTPDMMRRLAAVGITTREACGNSVRNVTACPYAGVCSGETFDVTPYAHALAYFLLGHPDTFDFGRKFKIAFSGCAHEACGLVMFHDLGAIARTRVVDGETRRAFDVYVGGGLGAVPFPAKLLGEGVLEEELLPLAQAVARVFARLGEKRSRARARIKFLVQKVGLDEFKRLVAEERASLRDDPRWTAFLSDLHAQDEQPLRPGGPIPEGPPRPDGFDRWRASSLRPQKQAGYFVATIKLPLGDATSSQARAVAALARRFTGDSIRTTVEQNLALRWVSGTDVVELYRALAAIGLAEAGAGRITDVVACPGTDTCKLGIASSRGLAGELRRRLKVVESELPASVQSLHIKASGCFNSCGQHHAADLGFYGVSRNVGGRKVPHFQVVLGGQWEQNAGSFGLAVAAVPSKNVPEVVKRLTERYAAERTEDEPFHTFVQRIGKAAVKQMLADIAKPPSYDADPSYYADWGDPREYTIGDMGIGECAGEIVPAVEFGLEAAERIAFEAQLALEQHDARRAADLALEAMVTAAKALVRHTGAQVRDDADDVVAQFRTHLYDTEKFHDPYAGPKFAQYFFRAHGEIERLGSTAEGAYQTVEEASLFIEAGHACYQRLTAEAAASSPVAAE